MSNVKFDMNLKKRNLFYSNLIFNLEFFFSFLDLFSKTKIRKYFINVFKSLDLKTIAIQVFLSVILIKSNLIYSQFSLSSKIKLYKFICQISISEMIKKMNVTNR